MELGVSVSYENFDMVQTVYHLSMINFIYVISINVCMIIDLGRADQ